MKVETFNLRIIFKGQPDKEFYNISRTAVNLYLEFYKENPNYYGFQYGKGQVKTRA